MAAEKKPEPEAKAVVTSTYAVAPGLGTICKRGVVADGAPVTADDFEGGAAELEALVAREVVIKS